MTERESKEKEDIEIRGRKKGGTKKGKDMMSGKDTRDYR